MADLKTIFSQLAAGIDPTTGKMFSKAQFAEYENYAAFKDLKKTIKEERDKVSNKGIYKRLCEEYPEHLVIIKAGYFYSAFNESAEVISQVLGYRLGLSSGHHPSTGSSDLKGMADGLRSANLSYVVYTDGRIEDKFDGNNPFA